MGYVIRYGQEMKQEIKKRQKEQNLWIRWGLAAVVILAAVLVPQARTLMCRLLFPWWNEGTGAAFEGMLLDIRDGVAIETALIDFCREVIANAGILV